VSLLRSHIHLVCNVACGGGYVEFSWD
jgi:hypothetical protein